MRRSLQCFADLLLDLCVNDANGNLQYGKAKGAFNISEFSTQVAMRERLCSYNFSSTIYAVASFNMLHSSAKLKKLHCPG